MTRGFVNRIWNWRRSKVSTEKHQITVNGLLVEVVRKRIKNLHLGVHPPDGRVRVTAPHRVSDNAVRLAVISKMEWIKRHQERIRAQPRQSPREMVSGESHYFLGQPCRLNVIEHGGAAKVEWRGEGILDLYVRPGTNTCQRGQVLQRWYREQLKVLIPKLLEKWQPVLGVRVTAWGVKKMKTRWGSCSIRAHRIWLNLELAKKPMHCLEYIVVHEMVHLLERRHNDRFKALLTGFVPNWKSLRQELNQSPLGHDAWTY